MSHYQQFWGVQCFQENNRFNNVKYRSCDLAKVLEEQTKSAVMSHNDCISCKNCAQSIFSPACCTTPPYCPVVPPLHALLQRLRASNLCLLCSSSNVTTYIVLHFHCRHSVFWAMTLAHKEVSWLISNQGLRLVFTGGCAKGLACPIKLFFALKA